MSSLFSTMVALVEYVRLSEYIETEHHSVTAMFVLGVTWIRRG